MSSLDFDQLVKEALTNYSKTSETEKEEVWKRIEKETVLQNKFQKRRKMYKYLTVYTSAACLLLSIALYKQYSPLDNQNVVPIQQTDMAASVGINSGVNEVSSLKTIVPTDKNSITGTYSSTESMQGISFDLPSGLQETREVQRIAITSNTEKNMFMDITWSNGSVTDLIAKIEAKQIGEKVLENKEIETPIKAKFLKTESKGPEQMQYSDYYIFETKKGTLIEVKFDYPRSAKTEDLKAFEQVIAQLQSNN